jgi:4'-phosphopantetheinyl transferase
LIISTWQPIQNQLELSRDIAHVIRVTLDLTHEQWSPLIELLSDEERARADRFRVDEPRRQFIICRATLRQLLGKIGGVRPQAVLFQYGSHGKPELLSHELNSSFQQIEFNVSHSGTIGLIAISVGATIGVDVEVFSPAVKFLQLAERFFAPLETAELKSLKPEKQVNGFYRGWTCKEAYIKARGDGLSLSLASFRVSIDPDRPASLCHVDDQPNEPAKWTTESLKVGENHAAAAMVRRPECRIALWDWPVA